MENQKRLRLVAYAGSVIKSAWWGRIILDVSGMNYKERLPMLREHQRDRPAAVLDKITREPGRLLAEGYFLDSPDGHAVKSLLAQKFPLQASVGLELEKIEKVGKEESAVVNGTTFRGPGVVVRTSLIMEISAVVLGADSQTSVSRLAASLPGSTDDLGDFEAIRRSLRCDPDPASADAVLAAAAVALSGRENIALDLAVQLVFDDPANQKLVTAWNKDRGL